nr:hypothetical protein [Victivallales bacterium]
MTSRNYEVFRFDGELGACSGWTYKPRSSEGGSTYLPFEGLFPDKGGRIQSEIFDLLGPGYYKLTFSASSEMRCFWWLDFFDSDGKNLPDCNSLVKESGQMVAYEEFFYVSGLVKKAQVAFVSKDKIRVRDIRIIPVNAEDAATWCDKIYGNLPPLGFSAPSDSMKLLPKTSLALNKGNCWRVVMLGDSIMNDSYNSVFQALVKRSFPVSNIEFVISVRGATGCWYYGEQEQFDKYVSVYKPDLLMIGGVNNFPSGTIDELQAVVDVIDKARSQIGCEIALLSQPLAQDWRKNEKGTL